MFALQAELLSDILETRWKDTGDSGGCIGCGCITARPRFHRLLTARANTTVGFSTRLGELGDRSGVILLLAFLVALFLATVAMPPLMQLARRIGLVDVPGGRKIHSRPIPLCGGLAIAIGTMVPVLMWAPLDRLL